MHFLRLVCSALSSFPTLYWLLHYMGFDSCFLPFYCLLDRFDQIFISFCIPWKSPLLRRIWVLFLLSYVERWLNCFSFTFLPCILLSIDFLLGILFVSSLSLEVIWLSRFLGIFDVIRLSVNISLYSYFAFSLTCVGLFCVCSCDLLPASWLFDLLVFFYSSWDMFSWSSMSVVFLFV